MNHKTNHSKLFIILLVIVLGLPKIAISQKSQTGKKPKLVVARPSIQKITPITKAKAQQYYTAYKTRIKNGTTPINPCVTNNKDTLQYLRLVKNNIFNHININDAELPEFSKWKSKYAGIRIYPYTSDTNNSIYEYILAYTKENIKKHDDIPDGYYLITVKGTFNWCQLKKHLDISPLTSHHLCQPNCPDNQSALLSF